MKTELGDVSQVKKRLTVEVPAADVAAVFDRLLRRRRQQARIPGFRPGKAPLELVKARLGDSLAHDAAEAVIEEFGKEACRRENLSPVQWDVETPTGENELPPPREGQDYRFTLLLEVLPVIEPKDYVGQHVARPGDDVEVEDVQRELEALRQSKGKFVDVVDRPSAAGDFVGAELSGVELGGEAKIPTEVRVIRLGDERNLPEYDRGLSGRRVGDEVAFEVSYPREGPDPQLAGRILTVAGVVRSVQKRDTPEWTDELARASGEGIKDFADLREKIKEFVGGMKRVESDRVARRRLLDKILDANPFEAPDALVEDELHDRLERIGRHLAAQGVDLDKAEIDWRKVADDERQKAVRSVREGLLLDAIAAKEKEHVVVEQADIERVLEVMARDMRTSVAEARKLVQKERRAASLEREVRRGKCLDWLCSVAHIS